VLVHDRTSTRKPQLTEASSTVLSDTRIIPKGINGLRAKVKGLLEGLEAEIHFVSDVMLPAACVVDALKRLATVSLRDHVEAREAVTQIVLERTTTVGSADRSMRKSPAIDRIGVGSVEALSHMDR
jgi:hypothetical protein